MIYTCQRCTKEFERQKKKAGYRFCSQKCANRRPIKLTAATLQPFVERGERAKEIAYSLAVTKATVRRAMVELGLQTIWASRRFKKCASPTVGSSSASTASSEATSQFVASVAPTA